LLRQLVEVSEKEREKFFEKIVGAAPKPAPARYRAALVKAMPAPRLKIRSARRLDAGAGSLGRSRWDGDAEWRGSIVVREAKALVMSAWARVHAPRATKIRGGEIGNGRFHSLDPWYRVETGLVVRRLSPNNRKIDAKILGGKLVAGETLRLMGFELANLHIGSRTSGKRSRATCGDGKRGGWRTQRKKQQRPARSISKPGAAEANAPHCFASFSRSLRSSSRRAC
jgi:hypothetical protein